MKTKLFSYAWDWVSVALTVALVYTAAGRLSITAWTPNLWIVESTAVLGTLLGLLLGVSLFNPASLRWLTLGYSCVTLPWLLSNLIAGEATPIGKLASLMGRVSAVSENLWRGAPIEDTLFFITLMCLLFWAIGIFSGFSTTRQRQALPVILPSLIPILVVQYYDSLQPSRLWMLGFYFLVTLVLIGRLNLLRNREIWKQKRVFSSSEPEFDLSRGLLVTALLAMFLAWSAPTPAAAIPAVARWWKTATQPWQQTRERFDDLLASLQGGARSVPGELYGNTMNLGQSALQGEVEIFRAQPTEFTTLRHYWRVRVYDTYTEGRWSTSNATDIRFIPETDAQLDPGILAEQTSEFIFSWKTRNTPLLVTPGYPVWSSRNSSIQNNLLTETYDLLSWKVSPPVLTGEQYRIRAAILNPTIRELRTAPAEYPDWVTERYLALPEDLADKLRRLASEITVNQPTTYDQAVAITNYLRKEIEYNLTVSPPPPGIDPVEWFLFTWKSGFCNYYASSEVLLLRAIGIPARMVVGYAPGSYQPDGSYKVSAQDAHAWPEVYFAGIGWVEFEPTASLDVIFRPSGEAPIEQDNEYQLWRQERLEQLGLEPGLLPEDISPVTPDGFSKSKNSFSPQLTRWLWVIILLVTIPGAIFAFWQVERRYTLGRKIPRLIQQVYVRYHLNTPHWLANWVRWSEVTAVERAFHAINQTLGWLGKPSSPDCTARERAENLKSILPAAAAAIETLVNAHEQTLYTPQPANPAAALRASWAIRYQAVRALLQRYLLMESGNYD